MERSELKRFIKAHDGTKIRGRFLSVEEEKGKNESKVLHIDNEIFTESVKPSNILLVRNLKKTLLDEELNIYFPGCKRIRRTKDSKYGAPLS